MKWKTVVGIILIIASILAMYFWETKFKDEINMTEVLVPMKDISAGDAVLISNLKILKINPEAKIDNALTQKDAEMLNGKIAKTALCKNQQLLGSYFLNNTDVIPKGYEYFVIPNDWIFSKSNRIGVKDLASFYAMPDKIYLGSFRIDSINEKNIEVIAKLEDYFTLYDCTRNMGKLLIVMEDDV